MNNLDMVLIKSDLVALALSENMGDVNGVLPVLCHSLGLPKPTWSDEKERMVMAWEYDE